MSKFNQYWFNHFPDIPSTGLVPYTQAKDLARAAYAAGLIQGRKEQAHIDTINKLLASNDIEEAGEQLPVEESREDMEAYENSRLDAQEHSHDKRSKL